MNTVLNIIGPVLMLCSFAVLVWAGRVAYCDTLRHRRRTERRRQRPRESSLDRMMFDLVNAHKRRRRPRRQENLADLLAS